LIKQLKVACLDKN